MGYTVITITLVFVAFLLFLVQEAFDPPNFRRSLSESPEFEAGPYQRFRTEPSIHGATLKELQKADSALLAPGYIFIAPFLQLHDDHYGWPLQILDQQGTLVYYGEELDGQRTQSLRVCDYKGEKGVHLCLAVRDDEAGTVVNWVLDNTYTKVAEYTVVNELGTGDSHEFNVLPGGWTFVQALSRTKPADTRPFHGKEHALARDGCFQEVDMVTGEEIFHWCYMDHYGVNDAHLPFPPERDAPPTIWDFAHLNSVEKTFENDYLVSFRHVGQIIKVAGIGNARGLKPGTVIWRLGGEVHTDFDIPKDARFNFQHDARSINISANEEVISLFNNWARPRTSEAKILRLNNETMKVTTLRKYEHPTGKWSLAQGSAQLLPNGNVFVGWGRDPEISEFAEDGTVLYHAHVFQGPIIYRAHKYHWTGYPPWKPKVVAYSQTCHGPVRVFVSWNGATEVHSWRIFDGDARIGTYNHTGFETEIEVRGFVRSVTAQALSQNGSMLGTVTRDTFVPKFQVTYECDSRGCVRNQYLDEDNYAGFCGKSLAFSGLAALGALAAVEMAVKSVNSMLL